MNKTQARDTARRTARAEAKRLGYADITAQDALTILDDIARSEPLLIASIWYRDASDNQIALFRREWRN